MPPRQPNKKTEPQVEPAEEAGSSAPELTEYEKSLGTDPVLIGTVEVEAITSVAAEDWEARILEDAGAGERIEAQVVELEEIQRELGEEAELRGEFFEEDECEPEEVHTFWDDVIRRMEKGKS